MRPRKPWYRKGRGWYVELQNKQVCLVAGPKNAETRAEAERHFHALMAELAVNPAPENPDQTVASVLDRYLDHAQKHLASATFYEQRLYLQKFADVHGPRLVEKCIPYHLSSWVDGQATWRSDWTRSFAIRTVRRAFRWGVEVGLIPKDPFVGVRQSTGCRRRAMTHQEFEVLLAAAGSQSRLGQVLRFMAATGCRPTEVRHLKWSDIDLKKGLAVQSKHKTSRTQKKTTTSRVGVDRGGT